MKTTKFKAWEEGRGIMHTVETADLYITLDGEIIAFDDSVAGMYLKYDDCELLQYTGLKDKNGKEIWEGDIVTADGVTRIIEFRDGAFVINNSFPSHTIPTGTINIEVVGNIYQNPELLG